MLGPSSAEVVSFVVFLFLGSQHAAGVHRIVGKGVQRT